MKKTLFLCKIEGLPQSIPYRNLIKSSYKDCNRESVDYLAVCEVNKAIQKKVITRFEDVIRLRGETVVGALNNLRARGFIVSRSSLLRWKRGDFNTFNAIPFNMLARYAGYPSFIEMVTEQD